jgi:AAA domain-containing protein/DnaB helicase-like protein
MFQRKEISAKDLSPPHSLDAESALLGFLLYQPEAYNKLAFLRAAHFYDQKNSRLFETFAVLAAAGKPVDHVMLKASLTDVEDVEGWFRGLAVDACTGITFLEYANMIADLAVRRDLRKLGEDLLDKATKSDLDISPLQIVEEFEQKICAVKSITNGSAANALRVIAVGNVEARPIKWVWPGRLAAGHLTLVVGAPGDGKSQISCDITARITMRNAWPDGGQAPLGSVVMLSAEDTIADVIRPRLEAAGADLHKAHVIDAVKGKDGKHRTFDLQEDIAALQKLVKEIGDVAVVIIDPITSYMGTKIDSHRTTDVRAVLEPLSRFAEETGVAVLAISHPPKAATGKAINFATGSLAFVAAARMFFITSEEPETERHLLLAVKNNLGAKAKGLGYRMEQRIVSKGIVGSHICWDSMPVNVTADEALQRSNSEGGKTADAQELILDMLSAGTMSWEAIQGAGDKEGISPATMRRARDKLKERGMINKTQIGYQGGWEWMAVKPAGQTTE